MNLSVNVADKKKALLQAYAQAVETGLGLSVNAGSLKMNADCTPHNVFPGLCLIHFLQDGKDHALIKCDIGLEQAISEAKKQGAREAFYVDTWEVFRSVYPNDNDFASVEERGKYVSVVANILRELWLR